MGINTVPRYKTQGCINTDCDTDGTALWPRALLSYGLSSSVDMDIPFPNSFALFSLKQFSFAPSDIWHQSLARSQREGYFHWLSKEGIGRVTCHFLLYRHSNIKLTFLEGLETCSSWCCCLNPFLFSFASNRGKKEAASQEAALTVSQFSSLHWSFLLLLFLHFYIAE